MYDKFLKQYNSTGAKNTSAIIIDKSGKVLSVGRNSYNKTHPLQKHYAVKANLPKKCFLHAEIDAIRKLCYNSSPHTIIIMRENNTTLLAAPCPICSLAIKDRGIKKVVYSTKNGLKSVDITDLDKEVKFDSITNKSEV